MGYRILRSLILFFGAMVSYWVYNFMKKFNNLSIKEAPDACDALLENSKVLLSSAELIAQPSNYGVAT